MTAFDLGNAPHDMLDDLPDDAVAFPFGYNAIATTTVATEDQPDDPTGSCPALPSPPADPLPPGPPPTWSDLLTLAPAIADLLAEALTTRPGRYCADAAWYGRYGRGGLRERVGRLAGPGSGRGGVLGGRAAQDVAGRTVYAALPPCSPHCGCGTVEWLYRRRLAPKDEGVPG